MIRWLLRKLNRLVERHFDRIVISVLFICAIAIVFFLVGKSSLTTKWPWLESKDSLFAFIIGILTIVTIILAFYSIRGLFERVITFDRVLREATSIIREAQRYVIIFGYYPGFGCVTMRGRKTLERYVVAIRSRIGEIRFITAVHPRKKQEGKIQKICDLYQFPQNEVQEAIKINTEIITQLMNNTKQTLNQRGCYIETLNIPDFHFVCNETKGVFFVPGRLPSAMTTRRPPTPAEVLGFVTSYIEFMEGSFEHFTGLSISDYDGSLYISNRPLDRGSKGVSYSDRIIVAGGHGNYSWKITKGDLPKGISINERTGKISGTPEEKKESCIDVTVCDSSEPPQEVTRQFQLHIL